MSATNMDDGSGLRTALIDAIEIGDLEQISGLVDVLQGDLDFVHPVAGLSPLQLAIDAAADGALQTGGTPDASIVRYLLERGATPSFARPDGRTALDIARRYEWDEVLRLLGEP